MSAPAGAPCPTCGALTSARFCGACGEQTIRTHDYSIAHFVGHVFESLTNFDFRSVRAFRTLVAQPGRLTRDYLDGRRRTTIGPIQLFVIVNVLFALAGPTTFRTPLAVQEHDPPFPAFKRSLVAGAIAEKRIPREEFRRSFDEGAELQAKTWVFALIPLFAVVTAALYGFRRYVFEHLIFATHVVAFLLAWLLVSGSAVTWTARLAGVQLSRGAWDSWASLLALIGLAVYLVPAFRRVFGDGAAAATARGLAVTVLLYPIVVTYRFLLFFVTLLTMH
jgi:hypothetical protein